MRFRSVVLALAMAIVACGGSAEETTTTDGAADTTTEAPAETTTTAPTATTSTGSSGSGEETITISGFSFGSPRTISVGDTVAVTNDDPVSHTWTSEDDLWDSGTIASGESFSFTFEEAGTFAFFCKIHPDQMMGSITVEG